MTIIEKMIRNTISFTILLCMANISLAMPPFTGNDFSGQYLCKGSNDSVGDYEVIVTLKLNDVTSHDMYGVYDFSAASNNQATYIGQIMAKKKQFSMTFKLLNSPKAQYSTGMGQFKKLDQTRWAFNTTYYEPDGQGGNFGHDYCKMLANQEEQSAADNQAPANNQQPS